MSKPLNDLSSRISPKDKGQKLLRTFQLHEAGMEMKRLQIARRNVEKSESEREHLFQTWLQREEQTQTLFDIKLSPKTVTIP